MQYAILIYETEQAFGNRTDAAQAEPYWGAYQAYAGALKQAGLDTSGGILQPGHTGTTVRLKQGQRQVQDGPYADTKEQLGGFILIDVPDLDAALDWAARCPAASYGAVEVRPVLPAPAMA
ncbi:YciI family protein [Nodosilinea sp. PGN35]|uniref:YciI family protein n=1 Tax=Nodosilinea sp. PGN35 TaxID=3020489 RepID=UPI0023B320F5|nr:YciI family protein [Nodosilinea sp. TSF1-S3]MDF0365884.1 YciI family protein [Nodosilinea sp. TSF1-S3]